MTTDIGSPQASPAATGKTALTFPPGFVWGVATAAYQIEGATTEDGRGPSIWDTFSHEAGRVLAGATGDVAADHYHRSGEDVRLMAGLGVQAYRFSIAWSRVLPAGSGAVNQPGLDFYSRLVDDLLDHQITPWPTLYHWDLPQVLQDAGGWATRDTSQRFADYAGIVGAHLADRVTAFSTINEPWCSAYLGHATGVHAPGLTDAALSLRAAHHLNLAHGMAVQALRAVLPSSAEVMLSLNPQVARPASGSAEDVDAVRAVDAVSNRIFLGPMLQGAYPDDLIADTSHLVNWDRLVQPGDLAAISSPIDLLGVNYYSPALVSGPNGFDREAETGTRPNDPQSAHHPVPWPATQRAWALPQQGPYTDMGWRIEPSSLTELLVGLHENYPDLPLLITENGAAFPDRIGEDGRVDDQDRIAYVREHLAATRAAIDEGVDVRGYFVWSLMDNFEWALGYSKRFGIVHVDYDSLARTPKASALWYRSVIEANGIH